MIHMCVQDPSRQELGSCQSFIGSRNHYYTGIKVWYESSRLTGYCAQCSIRCSNQCGLMSRTLTSVISTNLRTSLDANGDLHLIWDVARFAWNHDDGGWAAVMVLP